MRVLFCLLCLVSAACNRPPEAEWVKGETGTVSRVLDGDTFALNTGQVVRLVSVEAPSFGYRGRDDMPYAEEAKSHLEALALGRRVQLFYPGMTRDRYDRALAQVSVVSTTGANEFWLNEAVVRRGAAWVRIYPDTSKGSERLWPAEVAARSEGAGLWAGEAPVHVDEGSLPDNGFVIILSEVSGVGTDEDACKYELFGARVTAVVPVSPGEACLETGADQMEFRGWLSRGRLTVLSDQNVRQIMP